MAQLSLKEQRELQKLIKQNEAIQNRINSGINVQNKTLEKQEQIQKRINQLQEKLNKMSDDQRDAHKEANKLLESLDKKQRILNLSSDKFKTLKSKTYDVMQNTIDAALKHNQATGKGTDLLKEQVDAMNDIATAGGDIESLKSLQLEYEAELLKAQQEGNKELEDFYKTLQKVVKTKKDEAEHIKEEEESMAGLDDLMGGFLSKAVDFMKQSPLARGLTAGLMVMKALQAGLEKFSESAKTIGETFGAEVFKQLGPQIGMAGAKVTSLGYGVEDVNKSIQILNGEFGIGLEKAVGMTEAILNMSKATGTSVETGTKLVAMFGRVDGKSEAAAHNMIKFVNEMSLVEGIAPNVVLDDIANNAEFFAKYSRTGAQQVAITAMNARKLGLSLSHVEAMMSQEMDIAQMLSDEYDLQLWLGKDINAEKLWAARIEGDHATVLAETLRLAGTKAEFDKMGPIHKEKLAKFLNMEVKDLQKIVDEEDRRQKLIAGTLPLSKMTFRELVGEDAMDGLTKFNNALSEMGAILTQTLIPPVAMVLGLFGDLVNWISESDIAMAGLTGVVTALGAAMMVSAGKAIYFAIAKVWQAMASLSASTLGVGTAGAMILGASFIAGIWASLAKVETGGDMFSPAKGKTMVSTKEGGLYKMSPNDDLVAGPGIAQKIGANTNQGGRSDSVVAAHLSGKISETNKLLKTLVSNMDTYFGFGGSAVKGIGKETVRAGTSVL
jgi:myosin heavy subunit